MKAKKVYENFNNSNIFSKFERYKSPLDAMEIGKSSRPYKIVSVEEELYDGTPVNDLPYEKRMDQNLQDQFYNDPIEVEEAHGLLKNWEEKINPYYGFWVLEPGWSPDSDYSDAEWIHPKDLEEEWVELEGKKYYIPKFLSKESV